MFLSYSQGMIHIFYTLSYQWGQEDTEPKGRSLTLERDAEQSSNPVTLRSLTSLFLNRINVLVYMLRQT